MRQLEPALRLGRLGIVAPAYVGVQCQGRGLSLSRAGDRRANPDNAGGGKHLQHPWSGAGRSGSHRRGSFSRKSHVEAGGEQGLQVAWPWSAVPCGAAGAARRHIRSGRAEAELTWGHEVVVWFRGKREMFVFGDSG